jgi:hypothetical protein
MVGKHAEEDVGLDAMLEVVEDRLLLSRKSTHLESIT